MQKNNRIKQTKTKVQFEYKKIGYYLPIIFIILIVPLIVYCKIIDLPKEIADLWIGTTHADFFSYYKAIMLVIGAMAALMCR